MTVALGADHAGFALKEALKPALDARGVTWRDLGTTSTDSVDYPDYAGRVAHAVAGGDAERGILVCGSGVGMAIAANKVAGVRAAQIARSQPPRPWPGNTTTSTSSRWPAAGSIADTAAAIVDAFLATPFAGGRHEQRITKIGQLERDGAAASRG